MTNHREEEREVDEKFTLILQNLREKIDKREGNNEFNLSEQFDSQLFRCSFAVQTSVIDVKVIEAVIADLSSCEDDIIQDSIQVSNWLFISVTSNGSESTAFRRLQNSKDNLRRETANVSIVRYL